MSFFRLSAHDPLNEAETRNPFQPDPDPLTGDNDDPDGMLSDGTSISSSLSGTGDGTFMGKYSTQVFEDRAIDVSAYNTESFFSHPWSNP